jgi:hypothetical protein
MMAFDATDRSTCVVRRQSTNTPMQALVLMNDPQYVEAARVLAERMQKEAGSNLADQVMYGFRLVTGRRPNEEEVTLLKDLYSDEYEKFRSDRQAALDLLSVGDSERDPQLDTARTAAMAVVASMMINHDEAYTKR